MTYWILNVAPAFKKAHKSKWGMRDKVPITGARSQCLARSSMWSSGPTAIAKAHFRCGGDQESTVSMVTNDHLEALIPEMAK